MQVTLSLWRRCAMMTYMRFRVGEMFGDNMWRRRGAGDVCAACLVRFSRRAGLRMTSFASFIANGVLCVKNASQCHATARNLPNKEKIYQFLSGFAPSLRFSRRTGATSLSVVPSVCIGFTSVCRALFVIAQSSRASQLWGNCAKFSGDSPFFHSSVCHCLVVVRK